MKAESDVYIELKRIYKEKARKDALEIYETVIKNPHAKNVPMTEIENFCKNAAHLRIIHRIDENATDLTNISSESYHCTKNPWITSLTCITEVEFENDKVAVLTSQPLSLLPIYLALRATSHISTTEASDITLSIEKEIPEAASNHRIQLVSQEVARANGSEIHNVSALTGGMVAQEIIKIIAKQYIPIDNTCIFDGIASRVQILKI